MKRRSLHLNQAKRAAEAATKTERALVALREGRFVVAQADFVAARRLRNSTCSKLEAYVAWSYYQIASRAPMASGDHAALSAMREVCRRSLCASISEHETFSEAYSFLAKLDEEAGIDNHRSKGVHWARRLVSFSWSLGRRRHPARVG